MFLAIFAWGQLAADRKLQMRLTKLGYYADLVLYPAVVLSLIFICLRAPHSHLFEVFFLWCLIGVVGWTLVEYVMHRFVLHSISIVVKMHELHHTKPVAFIGTPSWLSLTAFALAAFVPSYIIGGIEIASGLASGLMLGYLWYVIVHDAVHRWRLGRESILYRAKLRHARHHRNYGRREGNFGVTTGLCDWLLGTAI